MPDDQLASELDLYRRALSLRIDRIEQQLEQNTETTERVDKNTAELVSMLNSWKGAMNVLEFLGRFAKPVAAIGALCSAWFVWKSGK